MSTPSIYRDRVDRYESKGETKGEELGGLSDRLTLDLRKRIQSLGLHPVLSTPWCEVAEVFSRIDKISEMEASLPKTSGSSSTLWECEEVAIRYILEDGKLNLCLRILVEYKEEEREMIQKDKYDTLKASDKELMDRFEIGCGVVMKNAWHHPEAMNITDLHMLIQHIADVLTFTIDHPERMRALSRKEGGPGGKFAKRQEVLVYHYAYALYKHMDEGGDVRVASGVKSHNILGLLAKGLETYHTLMREEEDVSFGCQAVASGVKSHNILGLLAKGLETYHTLMREEEDVLIGGQALALICDSEDYQTDPDGYLSPGTIKSLQNIKESILDGLIKGSIQRRKGLRPLLDAIRNLD